MIRLTAAALALALAAAAGAADTNRESRAEGLSLDLTAEGKGSEIEREFRRLLAEDDGAQADARQIADDAAHPADLVTALSPEAAERKIAERTKQVRTDYEDFLRRHPDHAAGHLAFGSFLNDQGDEQRAVEEYEKARVLDPKNPASWNNLAGIYAHHGPVAKSFPYYDEAIRLNPKEPSYFHSFGTLVFLFRRDATNYFKCTETEVFDKALALYRRAMELEPDDFGLAADYAQTFYGIRPARELGPVAARMVELKLGNQALASWTNAMRLADTDSARQGVMIHFARWNLTLGNLDNARTNLASVTLPEHEATRAKIARNIALAEAARSGTNDVARPASPGP